FLGSDKQAVYDTEHIGMQEIFDLDYTNFNTVDHVESHRGELHQTGGADRTSGAPQRKTPASIPTTFRKTSSEMEFREKRKQRFLEYVGVLDYVNFPDWAVNELRIALNLADAEEVMKKEGAVLLDKPSVKREEREKRIKELREQIAELTAPAKEQQQ
ncbi:unnamed protein product, partial [Amoebophrya sp. A120]